MQSDLARESQYSHKADDSYTTFFAETDAKVKFKFLLQAFYILKSFRKKYPICC